MKFKAKVKHDHILPQTKPTLPLERWKELTFEFHRLSKETDEGYDIILIHSLIGYSILAKSKEFSYHGVIDCHDKCAPIAIRTYGTVTPPEEKEKPKYTQEKYTDEFYETMRKFFRENDLMDRLNADSRREFTLAMAENDACYEIIENLYKLL